MEVEDDDDEEYHGDEEVLPAAPAKKGRKAPAKPRAPRKPAAPKKGPWLIYTIGLVCIHSEHRIGHSTY
jgi:hypothetical protein